MKKLVLALLVAMMLSSPAYAIEEDKILHCGVNVVMVWSGFVVNAAILQSIRDAFNLEWTNKQIRKWSIWGATMEARAVSFGKEIYDNNKPGGEFSWGDIVADEVGNIGMTTVLFVVNNKYEKANAIEEPIIVMATVMAALGVYMVGSEIRDRADFGRIEQPVQTISAFWTFDGGFRNWKFMEE